MFIGHFAIAFLLSYIFPGVPLWVGLVGVSFPDLFWAVLIFSGSEKLIVNPKNPLQIGLQFQKLPYSHSLILTNVLSAIVGVGIAVLIGNPLAALAFFFGSASHWLLDTIVHFKDLPILGFDGDKKVGLGLWRWGKIAFFVELAFYAIFSIALLPRSQAIYALIIGIIFHLVNANSFFGFMKRNPFPTSKVYAAVTLFGFGAICILGVFLL
jgi:hypothetical protein